MATRKVLWSGCLVGEVVVVHELVVHLVLGVENFTAVVAAIQHLQKNFRFLRLSQNSQLTIEKMSPLSVAPKMCFTGVKIYYINLKKLPRTNALAYFHRISVTRKCYLRSGNPYWSGRFSTVDLLIKIGCFVKIKNIVSVWKATDLSYLVQGGQTYWMILSLQ